MDKETVEFNIYPNPSAGKFTFDFNLGSKEKINISITDIEGKIVLKETVEGKEKYSLPINISKEAKGSCFLSIT
jgi:hypothetical protein